MSDSFVPTSFMLGSRSGTGSQSEYPDGLNLSTRVRTLTSIHPELGDDPETLLAMAQMPLSIDQLVDNSAQMFGMQSADNLATSMTSMSDASQRTVWSSLPKAQQMALSQLGYKPPDTDEESFLGKALGPVDDIVGAGLGAFGSGLSTVASPLLEGLTWIGDRPAHLYRTIRMQEEGSQWMGLFGAIAGGLAVAAAIPTGGASLAVMGSIGLGALGAATVTSGLTTALTQNPGDWWRAFAGSYRGEQTFDIASQKKVEDMLGDPRLVGLARDLADLEGFDVREMVYEIAGLRDVSVNSQFAKVQELAERFGGVGTEEYTQAATAIWNVAQDTLFQEAIATLQDGKISPGRDFADAIGLDPDSGIHSIMSGVVDGAFMVAVDPTLMLGGISKWNRARKYGLKVADGADAAAEFMRVSQMPAVRKYQEFFVDAVRRGSLQDIRTYTPEMTNGLMPFLRHINATPGLERATLTVEDFQKWMVGNAHLRPIMEGIGTVRGTKGLVMANLNPRSMLYREISGNLRAFTGSLADPKLEKRVTELVKEATEQGDSWAKVDVDGTVRALPGLSDVVIDGETGKMSRAWEYNQPHQRAVQIGRAMGKVPFMPRVGEFITATTTMVPPGRTISLTGKTAPTDIKALAELGRYMGMPSWTRRAWADAILFSDSPAARMTAVQGWLDNALTIAGARSTKHGDELVNRFLNRTAQTYGAGDEIMVNGNPISMGLFLNDQADEIAMPSLHELHRAAATGHMGGLLGVLDAPIIDGYINRVWKPAVLLRIGFITRAAGEEMLNFMFRGGFGGLVQETAARSVGRQQAFDEIVEKVRAGRTLTRDEQALWAHGEQVGGLVSTVRPVARMLARYGWIDPFFEHLDSFSRWTRGMYEEGLPLVNKLESPVVRSLDMLAGQSLETAVRTTSAADGWFARVYGDARLNIAQNTNTILMGNKHSWRRMAIGGVDETLIDAAREMQRATAKAIMDEVSSTNAGPYDRGHDPSTEHMRYGVNRKGEMVEKPMITLRSQPSIYHSGQWEYANGLHHRAVTHLVEDPVAADVSRKYITRIRPATVSDEVANRMVDLHESIFIEDVQFLAREFMGAPSRDGFLAALDTPSGIDPRLAAHLEAWVSSKPDLDIEDVIEGARDFLKHERSLPRAFVEDMTTDLDTLSKLGAEMGALDINDRAWAGQMLRLGTGNEIRMERQIVDEAVLPIFQTNIDRAAERRAKAEEAFDAELDAREFLADAEAHRDAAKAAYHDLMADPPVSSRRRRRSRASEAFAEQTQLYQQLQRDVVAWRARVEELAKGGKTKSAKLLAEENWEMAHKQYDAVVASKQGWVQSWDDLHDRMVDAAHMQLLNAANQHREMYSARSINDLQPFKEGQAIMWEMPDPVPGVSFEQLLAGATDRSVLIRNEATVRRWLGEDWARESDVMGAGVGVVADKELADQLFVIVRPGGHLPQQTARGVRLDANILQGRAWEGVVPITEGGDPTLWRLDRNLHGGEFENFDIAGGLTEKVRKQAEQMVGRMRQVAVKEQRQVRRARGRVGSDKAEGAIYPTMYERLPGGERQPVQPGTILRDDVTYVDIHNKPIRQSDGRYYEEEVLDADSKGEVMWALVGPMYEDMADQLGQVERWARKHRYNLRDEGRMVPSTDKVRVYRSDRSHVMNVDYGLPRYVTAPTLRDVDGNVWDKIVRYGFDKIIGPSIDALARKPMAFHFFAERFAFSQQIAKSFRSPEIMQAMEGVLSKVGAAGVPDLDIDALAASSKRIAAYVTGDNTARWTDQQALGWLRGHDEKEITTMLDGVLRRTAKRDTNELRSLYVDAFRLKNRKPEELLSAFKSTGNADEFMAYVRSIVGQEGLLNASYVRTAEGKLAIGQNPLLNHLDDEDWQIMARAEQELARIRSEAGEYAAIAAVNDMLPFIDSHELRTQMAEFAKPLAPFWYAEENFLKRWARTGIDQGPLSTVRRAQLAYAGLKSGGLIRTDEKGVDYFVYPGSSLLIEAVSKVYPGAELPVGALFQTRTDRMLPGLSSDRTGQPSFSPMLSVPMSLLTQRIPELAPVQRAMFGDYAASTSAMSQLVPNSLQRFFEAFTKSGEASSRYASAQMSAIAQMEAAGKGLPDNATAGDIDEFMRKVNDHARIILVSQSLMGFFVPGPPQQMTTGGDSITGLGVDDPRDVLSTLYQGMIQTFGIEQGTIEFLDAYPMANLEHIVGVREDGEAPVLALTQGRSESRSGAPLPATAQAMDFYTRNQAYMESMPYASPWLLPQADGDSRSQYAYDQQTINGLRQQLTPEEFLRSIKFKEAAGPYFEARTSYLDRVAKLEMEGASPEEIAKQRDAWDTYATVWKVTHPIFKEELESSDGRQRRAKTIEEMRRMLNDPAAPRAPHFEAMQQVMQSFDNYRTQLTILSNDRSAKGVAKVEVLKRDYGAFMEAKSRQDASVRAFWNSVLRPEASLD